jgi:hypothetical protein
MRVKYIVCLAFARRQQQVTTRHLIGLSRIEMRADQPDEGVEREAVDILCKAVRLDGFDSPAFHHVLARPRLNVRAPVGSNSRNRTARSPGKRSGLGG